jgi:hypothetical protein
VCYCTTAPSQLVGCSIACLTPSASKLAPLPLVAPAPSPSSRSLVVVLPICVPPPLIRRLCLSSRPSICWLLCHIVASLHLLVVASGLPPGPLPSHASTSCCVHLVGCCVASIVCCAALPAPWPLTHRVVAPLSLRPSCFGLVGCTMKCPHPLMSLPAANPSIGKGATLVSSQTMIQNCRFCVW